MGNSEVGHLTIGSGRILFQDLMRVNQAIRDGSFFENDALVEAFERARARGGDVHLLGLVSTGGVHSHLEHLRALLELARRLGMEERTWIHAFTDGRDVSPTSAFADLAELPPERIATIVGRYYAMDRDKRWDRTERALAAIVVGEGQRGRAIPLAAVQASYDEGVTDEFVEPVVLSGRPRLTQADAAIFFNFRPDRGRQLAQKLLAAGFDLTTMTSYGEELDVPIAFGEQQVRNTLAETLARAGARQLHAAETEKYAHVTYFFNGGVEQEWEGETRILVPSPARRPELRPQAGDVRARGREPLRGGDRQRLPLRRRQLRESGHGRPYGLDSGRRRRGRGRRTSVSAWWSRRPTPPAASASSRPTTATRSRCSSRTAISPHTAHTTNPVPLVLTSPEHALEAGGGLSDLAPTVLRLLGLDDPGRDDGSRPSPSPKINTSIR